MGFLINLDLARQELVNISELKSVTLRIPRVTCTTTTDHLYPRAYLGYKFESKMGNLQKKGMSNEQQNTLRDRCFNFTHALCLDLEQQLVRMRFSGVGPLFNQISSGQFGKIVAGNSW